MKRDTHTHAHTEYKSSFFPAFLSLFGLFVDENSTLLMQQRYQLFDWAKTNPRDKSERGSIEGREEGGGCFFLFPVAFSFADTIKK